MKGRYQLPVYAKFNRPDPMRDWDWLRPHTLNLYEYCGNDPINGWDPDGYNLFTNAFKHYYGEGGWKEDAAAVGQVAESAVMNTGMFVLSAAGTAANDVACFGLIQRPDPGSMGEYELAASLGTVVGDTIGVVVGAVETAAGGAVDGAGFALSIPTGGASLTLTVPATAVVGLGLTTAGVSIANLADSVQGLANAMNNSHSSSPEPRFFAEPDGTIVDVQQTPQGSYIQPNGGRTDIQQPSGNHGAGWSHTHNPIINTNPQTGESFINGLNSGDPVSPEDVKNIADGVAKPAPPKGR